MNNFSRKHHYIPEFYLKQWRSKDDEGIFNYIKNRAGEITFYSKFEGGCGYQHDLYTLKPETEWDVLNYQPDFVEKEFFKPLDQAAAIAHQKLITVGLSALTLEDKYAWALFLRSLQERTPDRINQVIQYFESMDLKKEILPNINNSQFEEQFDFKAIQDNEILSQLIREICNPELLEKMVNMSWSLCDCSITGESYLTSDRPLFDTGRIETEESGVYSIALSPTKLLVMSLNVDEFDEEFIKTLAFIHNVMIVKNASRYVYAHQELVDTKCYKFSKFLPELGKSVL